MSYFVKAKITLFERYDLAVRLNKIGTDYFYAGIDFDESPDLLDILRNNFSELQALIDLLKNQSLTLDAFELITQKSKDGNNSFVVNMAAQFNYKDFGLQLVSSKTGKTISLNTNIKLEITTIPGLNISLPKPISVQIDGLTFSSSSDNSNNKGKIFSKIIDKASQQVTAIKQEFHNSSFPIRAKIDLAGLFKADFAEPETTEKTTETAVAPTTASDGVKWFNINKKIAVVNFSRIGMAFKDGIAWAYLDASIVTGGFGLYFLGLKMGINPTKAFKSLPEFDLDGLMVGFQSPSMTISGFLVKIEGDITEYVGQVKFQTASFMLLGTAMYGQVDGKTSVFLYAYLDKALGGPAFFYVTGLALGFGYNRKVDVPLEKIKNFPLVKQAIEGAKAATTIEEIREIAEALTQFVQAKAGYITLMVGVKFSTFGIMNSFALLVLTLGERFRIDILGISRISFGNPAKPNILIEIALKASFIPDEGVVKVDGLITDNSFLFDKKAKLSGGFAFYAWFAGEHAGDFVITLGGYHPRYRKPAHYPSVPRVALNWPITSSLVFKGSLYFALTPREIMAGASVYAKWEGKAGSVSATAEFKYSWDVYIAWAPFKYEVDFFVSIKVKFTIKISLVFKTIKKSINIDVSADVKIWGPEFGGKAHVKVSIKICGIRVKFSFDIKFGSTSANVPPLKWSEFNQKFLPQPEEALSLNASNGFLNEVESGADKGIWVFNKKELELEIESKVPITNYSNQGNNRINDWTSDNAKINSSKTLKVPSMGNKDLNSDLKIKITKDGDSSDSQEFEIKEVIYKKLPTSIWKDNANDKNNLINAPCGFKIGLAKSPDEPDSSSEIPTDNVKYTVETNENWKKTKSNAFDLSDMQSLLGQDASNVFGALDQNSYSFETLMNTPKEEDLLALVK